MANHSLFPEGARDRVLRARLVLSCLIGSLALYALTCAPGLLWQDSAMFQYRVERFDLAGDTGLPLAHPLYIVLAKLFSLLPLGEQAFRVNLFSGLCGAVALALLADLLFSVTSNIWASLIGVISLAVSHTFWTHSVIAEVYNLYTVGLFAELCLIERLWRSREVKWLILAALVNGLNLSNHLMAILHWPAYAGLLYWAARARLLKPAHGVGILAALAVGSSLYLYIIGLELGRGRPVFEVLREALVGPPHRAEHVLAYSFPWVRQVRTAIIFFGLNFPTPLILLAPLGFAAVLRAVSMRWIAWLAGGMFVVAFAFAFRYTVPDQFAFFTPCYALVALFIGVGAAQVMRSSPARRTACLLLVMVPIAVYEFAPPVLSARKVSIGTTREISYRDNYAYFIRPRKNGYRGTERYAREALIRAAPDGVIYADTTIINSLIYARDIWHVEPNVILFGAGDIEPDPPKLEPDVAALKLIVDRRVAWSAVPDSNYMTKSMRELYTTEPDGLLFRLVNKPADSK